MKDSRPDDRIVEGFLPGKLDPTSGTETILVSGAHSWVEVYFPGHGWVTFDPTGGGLSNAEPLPPR
jgi:transglutaminase-like putative cysteine protease